MLNTEEWEGLCRMYEKAEIEVAAAEGDLLGPASRVTGDTFERLDRALADLEVAFTLMRDYWAKVGTN